MKHWLLGVALVCFGSIAMAQDNVPSVAVSAPTGVLTLGGIPKMIADKIQEAKPAGIVDFNGHVGGGGYLPIYTFHDMSGVSYVEVFNVGYRAIQAQKPSVMLMPVAIDVTSVSSRIWNFQWARNHVTRSHFPDLFLGPTVLLPLNSVEIKTLKIKSPKDWLAIVGSARF